MNNLNLNLVFILCIVFCAYSQKNDTLVINFDEQTINNFIFINKIDIYGKEINKTESTSIKFLFTNQNLKNKLVKKNKRDSVRNSKRIKGKPFVSVVGYSSGPPQFGIELSYYQKDSISLKNYNKTKEHYLKIANSMEKFGATDKKVLNFKQNMLKTIYPPLVQMYADESFLKNKTIFEFDGSEENYENLKKHLKTHEAIFIQMPYNISDVIGFKYHFMQVYEKYILPGL